MFEEIHQAVVAGYKDKRPLWISSPDESIFCIISKRDVENKSDEEIQEVFRGKHIVVYDQFEPTLRFDEKGLRTLGDLHKPVTIHGEYHLYPFVILLMGS
jgi:hypothetical protein